MQDRKAGGVCYQWEEQPSVKGSGANLLPTTRKGVEISMGLVLMSPTSLVCKASTFDSRVSTQ